MTGRRVRRMKVWTGILRTTCKYLHVYSFSCAVAWLQSGVTRCTQPNSRYCSKCFSSHSFHLITAKLYLRTLVAMEEQRRLLFLAISHILKHPLPFEDMSYRLHCHYYRYKNDLVSSGKKSSRASMPYVLVYSKSLALPLTIAGRLL